MRTLITAVAAAALTTAGALAFGTQQAQDATVREAIVATSLDYIEGWYEGDAARMARAVHADLAKRIARTRDGVRQIDHMGKETLVGMTARHEGRPHVDMRDRVRVLDVFGNAAVVRVDADDWVDYLQLARMENDRWVIVNVLWELRQ